MHMKPCPAPDPVRDEKFFGSLRELGVTKEEIKTGMNFHMQGRHLQSELAKNPNLRQIRDAKTFDEVLGAIQNMPFGVDGKPSPERIWAVAKCADLFSWD